MLTTKITSLFPKRTKYTPRSYCCSYLTHKTIICFTHHHKNTISSQEELEQMSEFLVLKSTQQQKFEGVGQPVDTAYIDYKEGQPILRACFDIKYFKPEEVRFKMIISVFLEFFNKLFVFQIFILWRFIEAL